MLYRGIQDPSVGISVALAGFVIADVSFIIAPIIALPVIFIMVL